MYDGNKIKFVSIATNNVKEIKIPSAWVPPNSEAEKIENPKNKIIDVYIILTPVSLIEVSTALDIFFVFSSCLYLAKK